MIAHRLGRGRHAKLRNSRAGKGDEARWDSVVELADIVSGKAPGRINDEQITLFKSNGIALEDIALAGRVYEIASAQGMGRVVPLWDDPVRAAWRKV